MKKHNTIILFILLILSPFVNAQMSSASLFGAMSSVNPAVINQRNSGLLSFVGNQEMYTKTQTLTEASNFGYGAGEVVADTDILLLNFFRGGKGGGLVTSEARVVQGSGKQVKKYNTSVVKSESSDNVDFTFINAGFGIGRFFGVGISKMDFEADQSSTSVSGSASSVFTSKSEVSQVELVAGFKFSFLLDYGFYYAQKSSEAGISANESVTGGQASAVTGTGKKKVTTSRYGLSVGHSTKVSHIEVGIEKDSTIVDEINNKSYSPVRLTGTFEFKISKFTLGYTGRYYKGGYNDVNSLLRTQLVYSSTQFEPRLENNINFAIGSDKGLSFSASASFSKQEGEFRNDLIANSDLKTATTIEVLAVGVNIGYAW